MLTQQQQTCLPTISITHPTTSLMLLTAIAHIADNSSSPCPQCSNDSQQRALNTAPQPVRCKRQRKAANTSSTAVAKMADRNSCRRTANGSSQSSTFSHDSCQTDFYASDQATLRAIEREATDKAYDALLAAKDKHMAFSQAAM